MVTTIQIQDKTWEELNKRKKRGQTFDDVIKKALLEVPEVQTPKKPNKLQHNRSSKGLRGYVG